MDCARLLLPAQLILLLHFLPGTRVLAAPTPVPAPPVVARSTGCTTKCGDIDVPYPFGLDLQCAIHSGFELNCTTEGLQLLHLGVEVVKISVPDGKSWLKTQTSRQCYDRANDTLPYTIGSLNLTSFPYVLSADDNNVIVLGCNNLGYMLSDSYTIGCLSTCDVAPKNGSCSGAGCCQVGLPKGVRYFEAFFTDDINNSDPRLSTTPCNYISVTEKAAFSFRTTYLTTTEFWDADESRTPVVMEWAISRNTCQEAKVNKETPYACVSSNSDCVTNEAGYLCRCSSGYKGNPYVVGGCTDIDECQDNVTYPCAGICTNKPGTFDCSCSHGKTMINGLCVKNHKSIWDAPVVGLSIGLGVGGGTILLLLGLGGPFLVRKIKLQKIKKMKQKFFNQNHGLLLQQLISRNTDIGERMIITLKELEMATDNFNRTRVVGGGGHGLVFKGILDLHIVAIKKSKIVVQREIDDFINEVAVLSQVNHRNVVKLLGCCLESEVPLLVYEFISNGTLYHHLHVERPKSLPWDDRLRIAMEVARALSYLHSSTSMPIFHRDIKSSNILLDDYLTAKVSDFGASRYIPIDKTGGVTTMVQGTIGYLDPMYYYTGRLTDKSDVFSFGVLLIEILTRKKPFVFRTDDGDGLVSHFTSLLAEGKLIDIIDPQIFEEQDGEEVAALAVMCTKLNGEDRPAMREVEITLENLLVKKKQVLSDITERRYGEDHTTLVHYIPTEHVANNAASRQYTMEEEMLLSASYPR